MLGLIYFWKQPESDIRKHFDDHAGRVKVLPMRADVGRVERLVDQSTAGRVVLEAVSYPAKCVQDHRYEQGTLVQVLYRQGNTLIVDVLLDPAYLLEG